MSVRTAVIAGGGPVGAVAAIMLAQQGWKVQVFEQARLPTVRPTKQDQRAYRLSLTSRALHVMKLANVNMAPIIAAQGKLLEATMYRADGTQLRSMKVPVTEDPPCVRAFRDELALWCIKEAQRQYPHAIDFHFNSPIQSVNFDRQIAHVHAVESHATKEVPYDLLVGADGAGSVVRSALQQIMPAHYIRRYKHSQVYSMVQVTPADPALIPPHSAVQMHIVKDGTVIWDGIGSDDCRVGLTVPQEHADAIRQGKIDDTVELLTTSAPSMPDYIRTAVIDLVKSQPEFYPMPSWTHLSQLHGPKTVLLGDAAHTMSPVLGQGLNSGMEDVAVFAHCLEQHQGSVDAALPAYNRARLPDVQAVMTLNEVVASNDAGLASQDQSTAHKLWLSGLKMLLNLHMISRTVLNKAAPSLFGGPRMMEVVVGKLPYRRFTSALYQDGVVFAGFLTVVSAFALHVL